MARNCLPRTGTLCFGLELNILYAFSSSGVDFQEISKRLSSRRRQAEDVRGHRASVADVPVEALGCVDYVVRPQ